MIIHVSFVSNVRIIFLLITYMSYVHGGRRSTYIHIVLLIINIFKIIVNNFQINVPK